MLDDLRLALALILHSLADTLEPNDDPDTPEVAYQRVIYTANPDEPEYLRWQ